MKELSSRKVEMKLTNLACIWARESSPISGSGGRTLSEKTEARSIITECYKLGFSLLKEWEKEELILKQCGLCQWTDDVCCRYNCCDGTRVSGRS